jgi:hypothetical protein
MRARGAVAVIVAASMTALMGFAAVGVDAGYLVLAQRRLQAATDAAALAGAMDLWTQTWDVAKGDALAYAAAVQQSATNNTLPGSVTITNTTVSGLQLSSATEALPYAKAVSGYNGIQVTQQASVPLYFARALGIGPQTISATSKAGAGGGTQPAQFNVMIILDSTASMNNTDSNCVINGKTQTRFACAKAGALQLITQLTNAGDNVGLMIFPPISQAYNFSCGTTQPSTASSYSAVPTVPKGSTTTPTLATGYLLESLGTGYLTSSGLANTSSTLVQALGGKSGCSGVAANGGLGTFYAEALTAAQTYLSAESSSQTPPGQNAIVLLSDGDATSSTTQLGSTFSSLAGSECQAAIDAATPIKAAGTQIYTIAYIGGESSASTCGDSVTTTTTTTTTGPNGKPTTTTTTTTTTDPLSPCYTMQQIASSTSDFFSDTCTNANGTSSLGSIFQQVAYALTKARLLPLAAS